MQQAVLLDGCRSPIGKGSEKGLYAGLRAGSINGLPGSDAEYERPAAPDIVATGGLDDAACAAVVRAVVRAPSAAGPSSP